jgi:hypothetical protein
MHRMDDPDLVAADDTRDEVVEVLFGISHGHVSHAR